MPAFRRRSEVDPRAPTKSPRTPGNPRKIAKIPNRAGCGIAGYETPSRHTFASPKDALSSESPPKRSVPEAARKRSRPRSSSTSRPRREISMPTHRFDSRTVRRRTRTVSLGPQGCDQDTRHRHRSRRGAGEHRLTAHGCAAGHPASRRRSRSSRGRATRLCPTHCARARACARTVEFDGVASATHASSSFRWFVFAHSPDPFSRRDACNCSAPK